MIVYQMAPLAMLPPGGFIFIQEIERLRRKPWKMCILDDSHVFVKAKIQEENEDGFLCL